MVEVTAHAHAGERETAVYGMLFHAVPLVSSGFTHTPGFAVLQPKSNTETNRSLVTVRLSVKGQMLKCAFRSVY